MPALEPCRLEPCSELELDHQLCFALYSTSLAMTKLYKPLLKGLGLTYPQYLAMLVLWQQDGITVGTLSKRLLTDPGSLTPLLKRLEADQLLVRQRSRQDERIVELFLTGKGCDLREEARQIPDCVVSASEKSIEALNHLKQELVQLRTNLQKTE
ncbi:Organic hydroperoxide resistance transcriptional regulator [Halomonas citrativorans]|uniref:Organic hydroperoxide resistance transcriptional regulator n=1 Tax=Halomonas citrativorans TaxID=2742612 RepID=A0A1R4I5W8_9GAMM|nr:MarR family transcriptional regulator [Halomonas citrativorans]SJN15056.1 Organic hydroperoxide resistance transcriptional regulator [Halomonas citrativorans]